ncbi:MAG TPA: hypothetical protein DCZ95_13445 [Verrucomicrobia bacterium]|nr:MAG: hypothetical protein A2X46_11300 [Lentisphaerae bacterium GWF2_57_35]HBA85088.1 hypothetical protein [Verrucomicrobiota bacterium]
MVLVQAKVLDPTHLELARPIAVGRGGNVFVVVTESTNAEAERQPWLDGSSESLRNAYGDSEPEYTPSLVRETNPGYGA